MSRDLQKNKVYVSGEQNLLSCQDLNQAEVVQFISHKNELRGLLDDSFKGVKVVFGEEGDRFVIGNSSMIVSKYQKGEQAVGSLGIIGQCDWIMRRLFLILNILPKSFRI